MGFIYRDRCAVPMVLGMTFLLPHGPPSSWCMTFCALLGSPLALGGYRSHRQAGSTPDECSEPGPLREVTPLRNPRTKVTPRVPLGEHRRPWVPATRLLPLPPPRLGVQRCCGWASAASATTRTSRRSTAASVPITVYAANPLFLDAEVLVPPGYYAIINQKSQGQGTTLRCVPKITHGY